ncbi:MAG: hypothetical protein RL616_164 [Verrucomicrobiota bacterium]
MDLQLEQFWNFVAKDQTLALQLRLFRLMCLTLAVVCLFVVLPVNLFETSLPLAVNLSDITLGLFGVYCYSQSCRGKNRVLLFLTVLILMMNPVWFLNGGINGSVTGFFFPIIMLPLVLCRGRTRWLVVGFVVLDVSALMLTEYFFPDLVLRLNVRSEWFLDNFTGVISCFIAIVLVVWVIVTSYDREQQQLSRYAKELAVSEENYRSVVENAMSIILRMDAAGKIIFINRFAEELFGYKREELVGRDIVGSIVPTISSKGESMATKMSELMRSPEKFSLTENENICRDGRRIWITWTNQPIYDEQRQLREILCVGADVTQRVALLEQLRLTQITMDAAAEQILWTDDRGRIIYANAAAINGMGYSEAELRALTLTELATDFPAETWAERWLGFKRDHFATFELTQRFKDGRTRPAELSVSYIQVAGKEYTAVFIRDLTGRRQNEEKRLRHEQQMQHLQRLESLGLLAGGIAHDFNNLLTAILANISLAKMDLPANSENHEVLAEAEQASFQAKSLTGQLLTFAKGGKPVKAAVNLELVIRDSTSFALRGKPVKSAIQIAPGLLLVEADAAQLTQVFHNLVLNACQAMPDGGLITIRAKNRTVTTADNLLVAPGDFVEVTVHDAGCGIPAEHLDKVFDPYFTTKSTGTGLGLAVVHSIMISHLGAVTVESPAGGGTTFHLLLPVSQKIPMAVPPVEPPGTPQRHRILIMDDDAMVSRVLGKILGKLGYEVAMAPDGETALQSYQKAVADGHAFDLVVMDLTIPGGMGGKETMRRILELDPNVKAVVSSGYSHDPVLAEHQAFGFKGVILKPYTQEQVQAAVRKALE